MMSGRRSDEANVRGPRREELLAEQKGKQSAGKSEAANLGGLIVGGQVENGTDDGDDERGV